MKSDVIAWTAAQIGGLPAKKRGGRPGLSPDVIDEIMRLRRETDLSQAEIAKRVGKTRYQVQYAVLKSHP